MSDLGTRLNHLYNLMGVVDLTYVMFVGKKLCSIFKKYILEKKNLIVIKFFFSRMYFLKIEHNFFPTNITYVKSTTPIRL